MVRPAQEGPRLLVIPCLGVLYSRVVGFGACLLPSDAAGRCVGSPGPRRHRPFPQPDGPMGLFHELPGAGEVRLNPSHAQPQCFTLLQILGGPVTIR